MAGETDLKRLLKTLRAKMLPEVFVFVTITGEVPAGLRPRMVFQEAEGTSLIITRDEALAQGYAFEFPSRMITLDIHSSLEAVGFMAVIATELAKHDMGVNPVAGFYHDHIFVPEDRGEDAMRVLAEIAQVS